MDDNKSLRIGLSEINKFAKALHCPTRWRIIRALGEGDKPTSEIAKLVSSQCSRQTGKSNIYYHLSELKSAGIIEVSDYLESGSGAPEKVWKLVIKRLVIDLVGHDEQDFPQCNREEEKGSGGH